ncbi:MAG: threonine/serine dehydratase [Pseudomonadota bacterium]
MITQDDIRAAAARIAPHVRKTPVLRLEADALGLAYPIDLKLELFQHSGTFKARGAVNSLLSLDIPEAGVVAASGGNHGAAVAWAAAKLGVPARVFVPEIAGQTKIGLIRASGIEPDVVSGVYADAFEASEAYRAESGAVSIHAYDAAATLEGQGTLGMEIEDQLPDLDVLLVAVGGGGLIGGIASWYGDRLKIVAVEPERAPTLNAALRDGRDTTVEVGGVAVNSLGARQIGTLSYDVAVRYGIESVLVPDDAIVAAQEALWSSARVATEPGGAAALAALTGGAFEPMVGARVGVLVCGANIDPAPF